MKDESSLRDFLQEQDFIDGGDGGWLDPRVFFFRPVGIPGEFEMTGTGPEAVVAVLFDEDGHDGGRSDEGVGVLLATLAFADDDFGRGAGILPPVQGKRQYATIAMERIERLARLRFQLLDDIAAGVGLAFGEGHNSKPET